MPFLTLADLAPGPDALSLVARPGSASAVELRTWPRVIVQTSTPPPGARSLGGDFWVVAADDPLGRAQELVAAGAIDAFPDLVRHPVRRGDTAAPDATFDDPSYGGQWYLDELGMPELYAQSLGSADVRLAVVDSGIDITSTDLAAKVSDPYDAYSDDDDPSPDPGEFCTDGSDDICDEHGTAVSGISASIANNGFGIVGMCPECTLVPIKLLGEGGSGGSLSTEVAAYQYALEADAWVINNSWGYTEYTPAPSMLANLIDRVSTENRGGLGAVVVFAAGNDDRELMDDEMEALPTVLCVSATDSYGNPTNYTNYGGPIDVAAPSATVSIAPGDTVITNFGGTSAASPVVAGLAGWILSVNPGLSAEEVRDLVTSTAIQSPLEMPDEEGKTLHYGWGNISPLDILGELFPAVEDTAGEDTSGGCGCSTGNNAPAPLSPLRGVALVGVALAGALLRRADRGPT